MAVHDAFIGHGYLSKIGKLGLIMSMVSAVFGLVSLYYGVNIEGELRIMRLEDGKMVEAFPNGKFMTDTTIYPLRAFHPLVYGLLALGLVLIKRDKIIRHLRRVNLRPLVSAIIDES